MMLNKVVTSIVICSLMLSALPLAATQDGKTLIITDRYLQALQMAYDLHKMQTRKGNNIPYISHLEGVASIVWKNGGTEDEAIAALLHDAVEDQGGLPTLEKIRNKFGNNVADIVAACSDTTEVIKPDWLLRKQTYIDAMPKHSASARLISAADKLDNIRDLNREYDQFGEKLWSKFTGSKEQTLWYYRSLGEIFVKHGPNNIGKEILEELAILEAKSKA